ncbi:MAG: hypothetical protein C4332_03970 [Meiothermus sp.]
MSEITLTEADDGRTVELHPGDVLHLELPENPSTGYRWSLEQQPVALQPSGSEARAASLTPGAKRTRILSFQATGTGQGKLQLRHWQEWTGESSITRRFQVSYKIN